MLLPDMADELQRLQVEVDLLVKSCVDEVLASRSAMIRHAVEQGRCFIDSMVAVYRGLMSLLGCVNRRNIAVPPTRIRNENKATPDDKSYPALSLDKFEQLVSTWERLLPEFVIPEPPADTKGKKKPSLKQTVSIVPSDWKTSISAKSVVKMPTLPEFALTVSYRDSNTLEFMNALKNLVDTSRDYHDEVTAENQQWKEHWLRQVDSLQQLHW